MISMPHCFASSGFISGSGFAMAKIMGFFLIVATMSGVNWLAADTPINTSAPFTASDKVPFRLSLLVRDAISSFAKFKSPLPL